MDSEPLCRFRRRTVSEFENWRLSITLSVLLNLSCLTYRRSYVSGIIKGDEIMVINGAIVSDLDMMYLESVLQEEQSLCMMMR